MKTARKRRAGRPVGTGNAEATRERILKAAMLAFADRGYSKTSNQQIAELAGITSGSLYHYFDSKAQLYGAVLLSVVNTLLNAYRTAAAEHDTCVQQLCAGLEHVLVISREHPGMMQFASLAQGEVQRDPELNQLLADEYEGFAEFFTEILTAAAARGELTVPVKAAVYTLLSCTSGLALLRSSMESEEEFADSLRAFQAMLCGSFFVRTDCESAAV